MTSRFVSGIATSKKGWTVDKSSSTITFLQLFAVAESRRIIRYQNIEQRMIATVENGSK